MEKNEVGGSQLARFLGTTPTSVSRWRLGKMVPDIAMLDKMNRILGWRPEEFTVPSPDEPEIPKVKNRLIQIENLQAQAEKLGYVLPKPRKKRPGK